MKPILWILGLAIAALVVWRCLRRKPGDVITKSNMDVTVPTWEEPVDILGEFKQLGGRLLTKFSLGSGDPVDQGSQPWLARNCWGAQKLGQVPAKTFDVGQMFYRPGPQVIAQTARNEQALKYNVA